MPKIKNFNHEEHEEHEETLAHKWYLGDVPEIFPYKESEHLFWISDFGLKLIKLNLGLWQFRFIKDIKGGY